MTEVLSLLASPFSVGSVEVPNRVVLGPMAGYTSSAYRQHLKEYGVGLVFTEMVSAYGLAYGNRRTEEYLTFAPEERPIAVQLFGDQPEIMAQAAELVLSRSRVPDILDINMGCPVRKVVKTGAGAALLGDPERAVAVARAVAGVASQAGVPVTVKLRTGIKRGELTAVELAPRLEAAGVRALTVHPRAAEDYYRGRADHSLTAEIARVVSIPVIASGDIDGHESAYRVLQHSGVTAVMVARAAVGDPWLVRRTLAGREADCGAASGGERPTLAEVAADLRRLLKRVTLEKGPERGARWVRKILGRYLRPVGAVTILRELQSLPDAFALDQALAALEEAQMRQ